jgi:PTS system mannitol-specific IIC component
VTPKDGYFGVLLDIAVASVVSFGVASMLLGFGRSEVPVAEAATTGAAPSLPTAPTPTGA